MLNVECLEGRFTPATTSVNLIPDWTGGEQVVLGRFNQDMELDTAVVALEGGSCRIMIFDGNGRAERGAVLLNVIAFEESFRGGGRIKAMPYSENGDWSKPDSLLVVPGPGGGPRVIRFEFDSSSGQMVETMSFFAPFDQAFRGGLQIGTGDIDGDGYPEALFLPAEGGGPRVVAVDMKTYETELSMWVGDPNDDAGLVRFEPTGATIRTGDGGIAISVQHGDTVGDWADGSLWPVLLS